MSSLLSIFTPSMMAPKALEDLFVQRHALAAKLLELIRESSGTKSKHYTLIVGPRGIGKTHLVSLIYHRVRADEEIRDRIRIAWLKEEEWGVASFRDLLLRILSTLATEYQDASLAQETEALFGRPSEEVESVAAGLLKKYIGDKTLLLIVENLDQLFRGLGDLGQKRLRSFVQETGFFTILATSTGLFFAVARRTSPFYGFFRIEHLQELDFHEAINLLRNIARFKENIDLANILLTPLGRARIRAVHHLAGGNHRVYVIFSQFLTAQSLDELVDPLMKTIDDLTPYYQSRMNDISQQQRGIVELLSHRGGALTVRDISQRLFITQQTTSRQLKTLLELGYMRVTPIGRESYYELREPLMRLCLEVKKNRAEPVRLLVDFLRLWYSPGELQERLALLPPDASWERRCLSDALEEMRTRTTDPRVAACLTDLRECIDKDDWVNALSIGEELTTLRGSSADWETYGHCLGHLLRWDEALTAIDRAIELDALNVGAMNSKCWILSNLGRFREAAEVGERMIQINPGEPLSWGNLGEAQLALRKEAEALESFEKAIGLGAFYARVGKAQALLALGRGDEALASIDEALTKMKGDDEAVVTRARILLQLGREEEALQAADKAIEIAPTSWDAWRGRGAICCLLGRHAEEVDACRKLVTIAPRDVQSWHILALALAEAGRPAEALDTIDKVFELGGEDGASVWHLRGRTLLQLRRFDEALSSLDRARSLGDQCVSLPFQKAQALTALGRWDEALLELRTVLNREYEDIETELSGVFGRAFEAIPVDNWPVMAKDVVAVFHEARALTVLGAALVTGVHALKGRPGNARAWYAAWSLVGKDKPELQLALRLLATAVEFCEKSDPRLLLELPIEERKLLESLVTETESGKPSSS